MVARLIAVILIFAAWGCSRELQPRTAEDGLVHTSEDRSQGSALVSDRPYKRASQHLPNLVQIHPRVISGGLPEGDAAFAELQSLGIQTIVSVDGAKPDVATARRFGFRYVHLPRGYDGISENRVGELAKAVRDLEGPIYIHCHHGKHRSPAAASVACVAAGLITPDIALSVLEIAPTSPHYQGLIQSVRMTKPWPSAALDALQVDFRETVDVPPLAEPMVALEQTYVQLQTIASHG